MRREEVKAVLERKRRESTLGVIAIESQTKGRSGDRSGRQAIRSCDRPGCYEQFIPRSQRQKFCSKECQRAMERVLERERRWRQAQTGPPQ